MRRDVRKLLVRKPELAAIHPRSLSEALNCKPTLAPSILWVEIPAAEWPAELYRGLATRPKSGGLSSAPGIGKGRPAASQALGRTLWPR